MQLPKLLQDFIQKQLVIEDMLLLPYFYPTHSDDFLNFQAGYRYVSNPETENLTGTKKGDFPPNFYVCCRSYFSSPFAFDITEELLNFPIYYAEVGTGSWDFYQIANDIFDFENKLRYIQAHYQDIETINTEFSQKFDLNLPFWQELYEEIITIAEENKREIEDVEIEKKSDEYYACCRQINDIWDKLQELEMQKATQSIDLKTYILTKKQLKQTLADYQHKIADL